ncbi:metalloendopeptidase [Coemansia javaensis]|uniref:Metalloendopeptidase n=1 Tax=Coemansia javaensis TaxID=2761396 RepID=A0A9W8LK43_9FUNG|nr:metalloendopeptidase [Coemansia javaensis]
MIASTQYPGGAPEGTIINLCMSASELLSRAEEVLDKKRAVMDAVALVENPTFANVIAPLGHAGNEVRTINGLASFFKSADVDEANAGMEDETREDVYRVVHAVFVNEEEMARLDDEDSKERMVDLELAYGVCIKEGEREVLFTREELDARESTRKGAFVAYNTRCAENIPRLQELVQLQRKAAFLTVKSTQAALDMLNDLRAKLTPLGERELAELQALKRADAEAAGESYTGFFAWEMEHYKHIAKEPGMLIVEVENPQVWHPTVSMYEVWGADDDTFVGHFYLDLYSRKGKFGGTSVKGNFVEVPSQVLKNLAWEPETLRRLSAHCETGEPFPDDMVANIIAAKNEGAGLDYLYQVAQALYDLEIHGTAPDDAIARHGFTGIDARVAMCDFGDTKTCRVGEFVQMGGKHAGMYYGYLWSEIIGADVLATCFKADGAINPQVGRQYRHEILRPCGTRNPMVGLKRLLGREPTSTAFLKSIGLDE